MKSFTSVLVVLCLLQQASAHYIFWQLTYGGTKYPTYTYVRKNTNYNSPVTDLTSNDLRCNEGGASGSATDTLSVKAGGEFTFTLDIAVYHQGATAIYMAKAPTTAKEYDGSGQSWFKIYEIGPVFKGSGDPTWPMYTTYTYRIPPATPNGEYLLRMEQLAIHNPGSTPQFYVSCAQISVTGGGAGNPGPLVSIPGHVKGTESGYTANIYNNFKSYTIVGPQVWAGQNDTSPAPVATTSTTAKPVVTSTSTPPVVVPTTSSSKVCHIGTTSTKTTSTAILPPTTSSSSTTTPILTFIQTTTPSIPMPTTTNPSSPSTITITLPPSTITITAPGSGSDKTVTVTSVSLFTVTTYDTVTVTSTETATVTVGSGGAGSTPVENGGGGGGGEGTIPVYTQCGGRNWTGTGTCVEGTTCKFDNDYFSQCVAS